MGEWGLRRARPGSSRAVKGRPVGPSEDRSVSAGPQRPLTARASAAITMEDGPALGRAMTAIGVAPPGALRPCPSAEASRRRRTDRPDFRNTLIRMRIHRSGRKHGVADADMLHAIDQSVAAIDLDDERTLYLGPDHAANFVEVVVLSSEGEDQPIVIHAMRMRPQFRRWLPTTDQDEDPDDS